MDPAYALFNLFNGIKLCLYLIGGLTHRDVRIMLRYSHPPPIARFGPLTQMRLSHAFRMLSEKLPTNRGNPIMRTLRALKRTNASQIRGCPPGTITCCGLTAASSRRQLVLRQVRPHDAFSS